MSAPHQFNVYLALFFHIPFSTSIPLSRSVPVCTMLSHFGSILPDCFSLITSRPHVSNLFLDSVRRGDPILPAMLEKLYVRTPLRTPLSPLS